MFRNHFISFFNNWINLIPSPKYFHFTKTYSRNTNISYIILNPYKPIYSIPLFNKFKRISTQTDSLPLEYPWSSLLLFSFYVIVLQKYIYTLLHNPFIYLFLYSIYSNSSSSLLNHLWHLFLFYFSFYFVKKMSWFKWLFERSYILIKLFILNPKHMLVKDDLLILSFLPFNQRLTKNILKYSFLLFIF